MTKTTAKDVIKSLTRIFQTHGFPVSFRTDNGPPFTSNDLENYLSINGIEHQKGIPYWPQSNGEVERLNKTLLKVIRIANAQRADWRAELGDFLFQYRVTTHTTTGQTPAERLMGRELRDKLPRVSDPRFNSW